MREKVYQGRERRRFIRLDYTTPLAYKVCKKKTISKLLKGYTVNISQVGLLCTIKEKVKKNELLWFSFDRSTLSICVSLEKKSFIYQNGILGKVVRVEPIKNNHYRVGIQFITREEKNLTHIYPQIHFLRKQKSFARKQQGEEEPEEIEPEAPEDIESELRLGPQEKEI